MRKMPEDKKVIAENETNEFNKILTEKQLLIEKLEKEKKLLAERLTGESFSDKDIDEVKIVVKEKEKPGWIYLGRGKRFKVPTFIMDKTGNRWDIRVASTDPAKLIGWLGYGYRKCTYREIGIMDKDIFPNAPNGVATILDDMIVLKVPHYIHEQHMAEKEDFKSKRYKAMMHSSREEINRIGKDEYGAKEDIARGRSLEPNHIDNIGK